MTAQAFLQFITMAESIGGRVKDFVGTADKMIRERHYDSHRIRHEVDETEKRWNTFYNSIRNYQNALLDSTKFFEVMDNVRVEYLMSIALDTQYKYIYNS